MEPALIYEIIGYVASVFTVVSLLMAKVLRLRIINLVACILWGVYGILIEANAVIATNAILMLVNIYFIIQLLTSKELFNLVEVQKDAAYLEQFLSFYDQEIRKIYPDFTYDMNRNIRIFFAFRNLIAAGIFIIEVKNETDLYLLLEFTVPGYQDFKISKYVYTAESPVIKMAQSKGFERVYSEIPVASKQRKYLESMGYQYDAEKDLLLLPLTHFEL